MSISEYLRRVHWALVLPACMVTATTILLLIAATQAIQQRHFRPELQEPARTLSLLLIGPGFFLTFWLPVPRGFGIEADFGRLPGIAVFWALIGWALDRKLRGVEAPIVRSRRVRRMVYSVLLFLSAGLAWLAIADLKRQEMLFSELLWTWLRVAKLRATVLMNYGAASWGLAFAVYFARKLRSCFSSDAEPIP